MRRTSRWCTVLAAALFLAACFSPRGPDGGERLVDRTVVTGGEIAESGAQTAWEALRLLNGVRLEENVEGHPVGLYHRGRRSFMGPHSPLIVVDGAIHRDFRQLDRMPAQDLASIRIRSAASASAEYGSLAQAGVLELTTHRP